MLAFLPTPIVVYLCCVTAGFGLISTLGCLWVAGITLWSGVDYFLRNKSCIQNAK